MLVHGELGVSIPKRVSEALKLLIFGTSRAVLNVSIPKRVSEALKPKTLERKSLNQAFQSLKGFQRL